MTVRPLLVAASLLFGLSWDAGGGESASPSQERSRIAAEQAEVERVHQAALSACYQKFAVSACVKQATEVRRSRLEDLKQQRRLVDAEQRKRGGAESMRRIEAKRERPTEQLPFSQGTPVDLARATPQPLNSEDVKKALPALPRENPSPASADESAWRATQSAGRQPRQRREHDVELELANTRKYEEKLAKAERRRQQNEAKQLQRSKPRANPLPKG